MIKHVLKAVIQNNLSLEYANINLKNDKENILALRYTSIDLQNNKEIILEALYKI